MGKLRRGWREFPDYSPPPTPVTKGGWAVLLGILTIGVFIAAPSRGWCQTPEQDLVAASSMEILISAENALFTEGDEDLFKLFERTPAPTPTPPPETAPTQPPPADKGFLRLGVMYESNIDLTASGMDLDLYRQPPTTTEVDDLVAPFQLQFNQALEKIGPYEEILFKYKLDGREYINHHREEYTNQLLEVLPKYRINDCLAFLPVLQLGYEDRSADAEYFRPDYLEHAYGMRFEYHPTKVDQLTYNLLLRYRDYNRFTDLVGQRPYMTAYYSYRDLDCNLTWHRTFWEKHFLEAYLGWRGRDSEGIRYDSLGYGLPEGALKDDQTICQFSTGYFPGADCYGRIQYEYILSDSNDWYYGYSESALNAYVRKSLPWCGDRAPLLIAYARYHTRQWHAQRSDPESNFQYSDVRHDWGYQFVLGLEREIRPQLTAGAQAIHYFQGSNDGSSRYVDDLFELYLRYGF